MFSSARPINAPLDLKERLLALGRKVPKLVKDGIPDDEPGKAKRRRRAAIAGVRSGRRTCGASVPQDGRGKTTRRE